jgi:hypothetical protein
MLYVYPVKFLPHGMLAPLNPQDIQLGTHLFHWGAKGDDFTGALCFNSTQLL